MHAPARSRTPRRLALVLLLFAACAVPPTTEPVATDGLVFWEARPPEGDARFHLLGTVHVGREAFTFDPKISEALAQSDALVLEVDPDELSQEEAAALLLELGVLEGTTLPEVVSPETWEATRTYLERHGLREAGLLPFEPWFAGVQLTRFALEQEGFSGESGVEQSLAAGARGKPIVALETTREQLEVFDGLSLASQEYMLRDLVARDSVNGEGGIDDLVDAWEEGDLAALEVLIAAGDDPAAQEFNEAIYERRNRRMVERIVELSDRGDHFFVAVGAGHMLGASGIPSALAERGFDVERVPRSR